MADIDIQPKKRPVWPWILGIIAVIIIVWLIVRGMNKNNDNDMDNDDMNNREMNDTNGTGNLQTLPQHTVWLSQYVMINERA